MNIKNGRAILVGVIFFVVTNAMAVEDVFGSLTPAELSALTRGQIILDVIKVLALAGTTLLAYLNQTANRPPSIPPGPNSPTP